MQPSAGQSFGLYLYDVAAVVRVKFEPFRRCGLPRFR